MNECLSCHQWDVGRERRNLENRGRTLPDVKVQRTTGSFGKGADEEEAQPKPFAGFLCREERLARAKLRLTLHTQAAVAHFDPRHPVARGESK
jgi:hypothetical protein